MSATEENATLQNQQNGGSEIQKQGAPDEKQLQKSVAAAQRAAQAQSAAQSLKERAKKALDPKEQMRLLREAYDKEVEAHGESKLAKRLQSGAWQGAAAGGGIGGGVAMGLGTAVGTLVTGVTAVPTVLVGGLIGTGVGAIHGPFIKFGSGGKGKKALTQEEINAQAVQEAERLDQAVEQSASTVPQPPSFDNAADIPSAATETQAPKRKPRKLEVRSAKEVAQEPEKRRPRKLQSRATSESGQAA